MLLKLTLKYIERYVGDVSVVRNPMHGATANVHGGFGQKTRLNLGEVVVRNGITLLRLRILSHGVDVFVYACEPQPLRG